MSNSPTKNGEQTGDSILDRVLASQEEDRLQGADPILILQEFLARLDKREAEVLRRRHGLHGAAGETLEEVGKRYDITRERVRQIEQVALQKLKKHAQNSSTLNSVRQVVRNIFQQHGGVLADNHFFERIGNGVSLVDNIKATWRFFLDNLLSGDVKSLDERADWRNGWYMPEVYWDAVEHIMDEIKAVFIEAKKPLTWDEFKEKFAARNVATKHAESLAQHPYPITEDVLQAYVKAHAGIRQNAVGRFGLTDWAEVTPKRVGDKIYVILQHYNKPLHYKEIAKLIAEHKFDHKKASAETVHNELILDKRFVLVGRGVYALQEWGYEPGVVADVVARILEKKGPLSKDDIVVEVLKQRLVKPETVALTLANRKRFNRLQDGLYTIVS